MPPDEWAVVMVDVARGFTTRSGRVVALDSVNVEVPHGTLTVVAGPSGSGKSTLLGLAACLDRPDRGRVVVGGRDVTAMSRRARRAFRRRRLGIVLPMPSDNLLDALDAAGNLRWSARLGAGAVLSDDQVADQLAEMGLEGAAQKQVRELSGGEQQRLALAGALVARPAVVLADEPTASLGHLAGAHVVDVLRRVADRGVTLLVASHDGYLVERADTVVRLEHGRRIG